VLILSLFSTALMCLLIFIVYYFSVPNPNMILITAIVLCTGIGGLIPGAVAAVLTVAYSMYFYSVDHSFFSYDTENLHKFLIGFLGTIGCYLIVGFLKRNRDRNHREVLDKNQELLQKNQALEKTAEANQKFLELSQSVNALLTNMPALTFSKDISTGKYLACNQLFAEYAHKSSPDGVVGLTDYDIFDETTADHFVEDDRIALSREEPYVFFEDVPDAVGFLRHFQTTKQKFIDQQGRLCTLGMCVDVTELVHMKQETREIRRSFEQSRSESLVFSRIASSLAADYDYVYYVNLDTDEYMEYHASTTPGKFSLVTRSKDFFDTAYRDAQHLIYREDLETFLQEFHKDHILQALREKEQFILIYRMMIDDTPTYVSMKISQVMDSQHHIVIGIMNIDARMKEKELADRIKEERTAYARINALTGDFIAIYSVDPETCQYHEYNVNQVYEELGLPKEGANFFDQSRVHAQSTVYHEDLEKFTSLFTRDNVLREIRANGLFAIRYRLMLEQQPVYVRLSAAMVEEKEGLRLIVGVINIEEQVKQDQEYEYHLSVAQNLAHKDELTGVRNKHAYADMERELNQQIDRREPVAFSITVFDVNELKKVNDTLGHQAGDEYLKKACAIICDVYGHSPVFRIGGDEFAVISKGQDYENAEALLARMQAINQENKKKGDVVIACGYARYNGEHRVSKVFEQADKNMYEDKKKTKLP